MIVDSRATTPAPEEIASATSGWMTVTSGGYVRVACVGDIMLDVIVSTERALAPDDDTEASIAFAPGGQAANVAAWVVALGGSAVVFGPQGPGSGRLAVAALEDRGVTVVGPAVERSGAVVSLVTG